MAVQAAKSALEEAGFAVPEPIYRLRLDEPAPTPDLTRAAARPARKRESKREAKTHDTTPDARVEQLVNEERAESKRKISSIRIARSSSSRDQFQ